MYTKFVFIFYPFIEYNIVIVFIFEFDLMMYYAIYLIVIAKQILKKLTHDAQVTY